MCGELVCGEFVGVDKQPEGGISPTENAHRGHAFNTRQGVVELLVDQAIEVGGVVLAFRGADFVGEQD